MQRYWRHKITKRLGHARRLLCKSVHVNLQEYRQTAVMQSCILIEHNKFALNNAINAMSHFFSNLRNLYHPCITLNINSRNYK